MIRLKFIAGFLAAISILGGPTGFAPTATCNAETWTLHSSFDNQPRKIFESDSKVFVFVHQRKYNYDTASSHPFEYCFNDPSGAIFVLDKSNIQAGFKDLQQLAPLSSARITGAAYNPNGRYLLVTYDSGKVDFVTENYEVSTVSILPKGSSLPGTETVNSIDFMLSNSDAWISNDNGFTRLSFDGKTAKIVTRAIWGKKVTSINAVGDKYIAIINGSLYEADATGSPAIEKHFNEIPGISVSNPTSIMPLSQKHFAFLDNNSTVIKLATLGDNGNWSVSTLASDSAIPQTDRVLQLTSIVEHTVIPTATGYMVASPTKAYMISRPASETDAPAVATAAFSKPERFASSWDSNKFWVYKDRSKFQSMTQNNGSWQVVDTPTLDAPATCYFSTLQYSDAFGMAIASRGSFDDVNFQTEAYPLLLSTYKDGKWTNVSNVFLDPPYITEESTTYKNLYEANKETYPVSNPFGLCFDPWFPDYAYTGSYLKGFAAVNVADMRKTPLLLMVNNKNNVWSQFPCDKSLPQRTWPAHAGIMWPAGFDQEGNLWALRSTFCDAGIDNRDDRMEMWYWSLDSRRPALESGDIAQSGGWKKLNFKSLSEGFISPQAIVLRHPNNKNKFVALMRGSGGYTVVIADHNGTLEDTSDDTSKVIVSPVNLQGGKVESMGYMFKLAEDPITGKVLVSTFYNQFEIDPNAPVSENGEMKVEFLKLESLGGGDYEASVGITAYDACFDEYGRLWLASAAGGVYGISADRSEMFAHYTMENSPIPSNLTTAVCWNPATKSLFISTDHGLAEVRPDAPTPVVATAAPQAPVCIPSAVTPEHAGTVALHNIPAESRIAVIDRNGKAIAYLPASQNGITHWDLRDSEGNNVATGVYKLTDANKLFKTIYLPVTR